MSWLAVQCKPRQEQLAADNLLRQGFDVFYPRIVQRKRVRNCWRDVTGALFPGYLFINVELGQQDSSVVRSTQGVIGLVRFGVYPAQIPDSVIEFLKSRQDPQLGAQNDSRWPHRSGDQVEILDGPFAGLHGIYQVAKDSERAVLLIELLGRSSEIAVAHKDLGEAL